MRTPLIPTRVRTEHTSCRIVRIPRAQHLTDPVHELAGQVRIRRVEAAREGQVEGNEKNITVKTSSGAGLNTPKEDSSGFGGFGDDVLILGGVEEAEDGARICGGLSTRCGGNT